MWFKLLRQALLAPTSTVLGGLRFWFQHRTRLRHARLLCQCADGLRLRRLPNWDARSSRLYRRVARGLHELVPFHADAADDAGQDAGQDWSEIAHSTLKRAQEPMRALAAGLAVMASALAVATVVVLLVGCAISPNLKGRLFPRDLAAGKPWVTNSTAFGLPASGFGPSTSEPLFFHTGNINKPHVDIDLGADYTIRGIEVENRSDCCKERALPLDVKVLVGETWQLVAERRAYFTTWSYDITPVRARKIRFERPGSEVFHLKRISVYGQ
jgi:hypothetical protein